MQIKKLLMLAIAGLVTLSCEKEVVKQEEQAAHKEDTVGPSTSISQKAGSGRVFLLVINQSTKEEFADCAGSGGNCGPTITVTGASLSSILEDIYAAIGNGDDDEVSELFDMHQAELESLFTMATIADVINGDLTLNKYDDLNGDPIVYLTFHNSSETVEYAQPINI